MQTDMMCNWSSLLLTLAAVFHLLQPNIAEEPAVGLLNRGAQSLGSRTLFKRKVGGLEITTTPLDYMKKVGETIADEEGRPRDLFSSPTSVWCFQDKGVVFDEYREKPAYGGGRCASISKFIFDWEGVANMTQVNLTEGRLRPYVQVIQRLIDVNETINVNFSVSLRLGDRSVNSTELSESDIASQTFFLVETVAIAHNSNMWIELNITEAMRHVWTMDEVQPPVIEVVLRMAVDCIEHKKVPIQLINPAEVRLTTPIRRQKYTDLQPLLTVFLEDSIVKKKLLMEYRLTEEEEAMSGADITEERSVSGDRKKRSYKLFQDPYVCKKENFTVNFVDLRLRNIIIPLSANIGRCAGDCSHGTLKLKRFIATNHAKIKASAKLLNDRHDFKSRNSSMYLQSHRDPCCIPTEYRAIFLLIRHTGAFRQQLYPEFIVSRCGCR